MTDSKETPRLKLLKSSASQMPGRGTECRELLFQPDLFPMPKSALLVFANTANLSGERFLSLLIECQPSLIVDMRPTPRFDLGRLNRKTAFEAFRENQIRYIDTTGVLGISCKWDANLNPALMVDQINKFIHKPKSSIKGPIVFLFDDTELLSSSMEIFRRTLSSGSRKKWDVYLVEASHGL